MVISILRCVEAESQNKYICYLSAYLNIRTCFEVSKAENFDIYGFVQ